MAAGGQLAEEPKPLCLVQAYRESLFLAVNSEEVPSNQLLLNPHLAPSDASALAIVVSPQEDEGQTEKRLLVPLFTVNMEDWRHTLPYFFQILMKWVGGREALESLLLRIPCGFYARECIFHEVREDCHDNYHRPKSVSICETCGKVFEYNRYLLREANKYKKHAATHNTTCRICGLKCATFAEKKYHQRTHREVHFPCPKEKCKFVGITQKSLDNHIHLFHTAINCKCPKTILGIIMIFNLQF